MNYDSKLALSFPKLLTKKTMGYPNTMLTMTHHNITKTQNNQNLKHPDNKKYNKISTCILDQIIDV